MSGVRRLLVAGVALSVTVAALRAQEPAAVRVLPVQGNVHLIAGAGMNVTVQVGRYGVLLVDTPAAAQVPQVLAEIRKLSPLPLRFIVNTSVDADAIAGNGALTTPAGGRGRGLPFAFVGLNRASVVAHENVLNRLANPPAGAPATPAELLPTTTYYLPTMDFSNGEAVILHHVPAAHTDGDSVVLFRESDVISTGAIFTPGRYPEIDVARGGSVNGLIAALGKVLELAVPDGFASGGTLIVPGRGRICEETDVAEYRDMVAIVRDRVQDMIAKKMTLPQIAAARPSRDYDAEYGATQRDADRFVEAMYRSLTQSSSAARGRS
jgi:glyoxylase-like metal-dependent hydrolase (beta-lactamase superfamily II)